MATSGNKLSQLVKNADKGIPQYITVHGRNTAVILSTKEYEKLKRPASHLSSALLMPIIDEEDGLLQEEILICDLLARHADCFRVPKKEAIKKSGIVNLKITL